MSNEQVTYIIVCVSFPLSIAITEMSDIVHQIALGSHLVIRFARTSLMSNQSR